MSDIQLIKTIESYNEWSNLAEEASKQAKGFKDALVAFLEDKGVEEFKIGQYIIRNTEVSSNRFDSTAFKRVHEDLYKAFLKMVLSHRFSVSQ